MNEKNKTMFDEMNLLDMQKQFMDAVMAFNSSGSFDISRPAHTSPWADAMDYWWQSVKPATSHSNQNVFEKMMEQARSYYFISQQFSKMAEGMANMKSSSDDFTTFINDKFKEMQSLFSANQNMFNWHGPVDPIEQPMDFMKNSFAESPLFSGGLGDDFSLEMKKLRERFLTMPGFGHSREMQEKMQEAVRLWAVYQDNNQEYQTRMSALGHDALELMRKKLLSMHESGEEVNSMRDIYNVWVDSNEQAYGEFVFTKEYADMNSRLVNSLMAFKQQTHEINEDILKSMNMPTTSSVKSLERRQYELRKQVRALEKKLKNLQTEVKPGKAEKPAGEKKSVKTASKSGKKKKTATKKASAPQKPTVVEFSHSGKKTAKKNKTTKKNDKTKRQSGEKRMIEIKF